jgi:hypothetical protein
MKCPECKKSDFKNIRPFTFKYISHKYSIWDWENDKMGEFLSRLMSMSSLLYCKECKNSQHLIKVHDLKKEEKPEEIKEEFKKWVESENLISLYANENKI